MKKEINLEIILNDDDIKEVIFGDCKYLHTSDEEYDYLIGQDNGIKIILEFTKDEEKNQKALEGIETFFSWL